MILLSIPDNNISIHAPREGGDNRITIAKQKQKTFQSTPPARGATAVGKLTYKNKGISIHAPREGGDAKRSKQSSHIESISIHAPREGGDSKDAQFYL